MSASIDDDQYFELMMRNAWHLEGGSGVTESTTIQRKLVTGPDGSQRVVKLSQEEDARTQFAKNTNAFWGGEV